MTNNVAFFGTSDKSIPLLESLHENFILKLCVTKSDRIVGRKKESKPTKVKEWALTNGITVLEVDSLKSPVKEQIVEQLNDSNIEVGVVADFSFIIPEEIINTPKYQLINVHFSLLPKYRGASPVQHAILNGDKVTGVTFYVMDKNMDTGPILYQKEFQLKGDETTKELYTVLFEEAAKKLPEIVKNYTSGKINPEPQDESNATYCYSKSMTKSTYIMKEDARINWKDDTDLKIYNKIRAFNPWPIAWTTLGDIKNSKLLSKYKIKDNKNKNLKIKIYSAEISSKQLNIRELQVEGKNKISWEEFKNGYLEEII